MGKVTKPSWATAIVIWVAGLFGIAIVHTKGVDARPSTAGYLTVSAALLAGETCIVVAPGTYAENVTVGTGVRLILLGATVGAGAGPAVAIASGSATVGGWGALSATAAISAAVGTYLSVGEGVDLTGTVSGVYRVGRRWVLQSGEAVATYLPADGSVVSDVQEGDELIALGYPDDVWTARTADGARRWVGSQRIEDTGTRGTNSIPVSASNPMSRAHGPVRTARVWYRSAMINGQSGAPCDATDRWRLELQDHSSNILWSYETTPDGSVNYVTHRVAVDEVFTVRADLGTGASPHVWYCTRLNAPGAYTCTSASVSWAPVLE